VAGYLSRLTDATRQHVLEIATQYRAVFSDESTSDASVLSTPSSASGVSGDLLDGVGGVLHSWLSRQVAAYLSAFVLCDSDTSSFSLLRTQARWRVSCGE
jgi:hypothetical protein